MKYASYTLITLNNGKVAVLEKTPYESRVIKTFETEQLARQLKNKLGKGGGFAGWTPSFFLRKEDQP